MSDTFTSNTSEQVPKEQEDSISVNSGETTYFSYNFTKDSLNLRKIDAQVKFVKTHPDAKIPTKNHTSDTGFDVYSVEHKVIPARGSAVVDVGLEFADITPGYWVRVEGRSGLGFKHGIAPHFGIIDQPYRGNAGIKLYNNTDVDYTVSSGDRIAQFVVYKNYTVVMGEGEKTETERGVKGFGSSGQ